MSSFGSGMLFAVPILQRLLAHFRCAPTRLGGLDEVPLTLTESGQRLACVDGVDREVVLATARDLTESGFGASGLEEGIFLMGTGSNGVCESMAAMGGGVFLLMQAAAWGYRMPRTRVYQPPAAAVSISSEAAAATDPSAAAGAASVGRPEASAATTARVASAAPVVAPPASDITLAGAMKTPNFYLLFLGSVGVCMTGLPFIQLGKFMVNDIFGAALGPSTAMVAAGFPSIVAAANIAGRASWGPISDRLGCSNTTLAFGVRAHAHAPWDAHGHAHTHSTMPTRIPAHGIHDHASLLWCACTCSRPPCSGAHVHDHTPPCSGAHARTCTHAPVRRLACRRCYWGLWRRVWLPPIRRRRSSSFEPRRSARLASLR